MNPRRLKKIINFRGVVGSHALRGWSRRARRAPAVAWRLAVTLSRRADRRGVQGKAVAGLGAMAAPAALRWPGADGLAAARRALGRRLAARRDALAPRRSARRTGEGRRRSRRNGRACRVALAWRGWSRREPGELTAFAGRLAVTLSRLADRRGVQGKAVAGLGAMAAPAALRWPGADGLDAPASISRPSLGPVRAAPRKRRGAKRGGVPSAPVAPRRASFVNLAGLARLAERRAEPARRGQRDRLRPVSSEPRSIPRPLDVDRRTRRRPSGAAKGRAGLPSLALSQWVLPREIAPGGPQLPGISLVSLLQNRVEPVEPVVKTPLKTSTFAQK